MTTRFRLLPVLFLILSGYLARAENTTNRAPAELFKAALHTITALVEPSSGIEPQTFSARLNIMKGDGLPKEIVGQSAILAFQAPDRLTISADYKGKTYSAGRNQQEVWVYVPDKKFGVIGQPGQPRFASAPEKKDPTKLGPFKLPLPKEQLSLLPLLMRIETQPEEEIEKVRCHVLQVTPKPEAIEALKIPDGTLKLWVRTSDDFPVRLGYADGKAINVEIQFQDVQFSAPWPAERWKLPAQAADKIETTALGHLTRFASVIISGLNQRIPPLGPSVGQRNGGNFPRKLRIRLKRPRLGI